LSHWAKFGTAVWTSGIIEVSEEEGKELDLAKKREKERERERKKVSNYKYHE
jgi:hypothetical protein